MHTFKIFTTKRIAMYEPITIDYKWDGDLLDFVSEDAPCLCRSSGCRGFLMLARSLDRSDPKYRKGKYKNYTQLFIDNDKMKIKGWKKSKLY